MNKVEQLGMGFSWILEKLHLFPAPCISLSIDANAGSWLAKLLKHL
jgi:hypothetical protein